MRIKTIETERLYLRSFEREDARFAISIWNDPEMGKYLPDEAMDEVDENYLKEIEALSESEECCYMISEFKDTHERAGTCSFIPSEDGSSYDIAYCVHRRYWNNGYAAEMAKGMVDYARSQKAEKVTVRVNRENIASNKIAKKLGFKLAGEKFYRKRGTDLEYCDYLYELIL